MHHKVSGRFRSFWKVQGAFFILALLWLWVSGKNTGWDLFNHQLYLPFSWDSGRIKTDFFAAGAQGYQSPVGYFPFYYMLRAGWPDWSIGITLGLLHALNAGCIWLIARCLWKPEKDAGLWTILAAGMACLTPVFIQLVGTSHTDPISSVFVLFGLFLLLAYRSRGLSFSFFAGCLFGLAFAIKQSNIVYGIAAGLVLFLHGIRAPHFLKSFAFYLLGGLIVVGAAMGFWMLFLWQRFSNPVFPLYNNIFHSPFASDAALIADRFIPAAPMEWITRIWEMTFFQRFVYIEQFAPDIRPIVVVMLGLLFTVFYLCVQTRKKTAGKPDGWDVADTNLSIFVVCSYGLWLLTSGNGRYGLPVLMLFGVLLVRFAFLCFSARIARIAILTVGVIQASMSFMAINAELSAGVLDAWEGGPYFDVRVPARLLDEPALHLTIGVQTHAYLAFFLNHDGAMISLIGGVSLPETGAAGEELRRQFEKWKDKTRVLMWLDNSKSKDNIKLLSDYLTVSLYRFGLDVDTDDCEFIEYSSRSVLSDGSWLNRHSGSKETKMMVFLSCRVIPTQLQWPEFEEMRQEADHVFGLLESVCPAWLSPPGVVTDRHDQGWVRFYPNTDATVAIYDDGRISMKHLRSMGVAEVTVKEILEGNVSFSCERWNLRTPE